MRGQRMIAVAENLASTPIVRDRFADPFAAQVLAPEVDRAVALSGAGMAEILGPDGTIRVSSDPSRIGRRDGPRPEPGRRGPGLVRRRRHRRRAQPGRSGADPVDQRRRARRRIGQSSRIRRCGNCSAARARRLLVYLGLGAALGPAGVVAAVAADQATHPRPGGRRDRQAWPIIGKRCCTASARAWSR